MAKPVAVFQGMIHDYITRGNVDMARRELSRLELKRVTRNEAAPLARLARRAGLPLLSLKLLYPLVRGPGRKRIIATADEQIEYAMGLTRLGAWEEAEFLIDSLESAVPEALMCRVSVLVGQWRYAESIPLLQKYLNTPSLEPYDRLVAEINLGAAFTEERRLDAAAAVLEPLLKSLKRDQRGLLYSNALELMAQVDWHRGDFTRARAWVSEARKLVAHRSSPDAFFVDKLTCLMDLQEKKAGAAENLSRLRREAGRLGQGETLRDLDRWEGVLTGNSELVLKACFGTPFECFRKWALADFSSLTLPDFYLWRMGSAKKSPELNLSGTAAASAWGAPSGIALRTLNALSRDFYRRYNASALHQALFPGEYYNPSSSPARVAQAVSRTRRWLRTHRVPMTVQSRDGQVFLEATGILTLRLPLYLPDSRSGWLLVRLKSLYGDRKFTSAEVVKSCGVSARSARRHLEQGCASRALVRQGKGRGAGYRFPSPSRE